jgi:hypothetical protein
MRASRGSALAVDEMMPRERSMEPTARPFFEREIKAFRLRAADGRMRIVEVRVAWEGHRARRVLTWVGFKRRPGERIVEALLSCEHWYLYRRPVVPPSARVSARCDGCGAGLKKATAEGQIRRRVQRALFDVFGQASIAQDLAQQARRQQHVVEMVLAAWSARALHATTQQAEGIYQNIDRHGRLAGLFEDPDPEEDDERGARL